MDNALGDLTVVEGASFIAGPSCALHLAQMGATVIRFDMIGGGPDYNRMPRTDTGESLYWQGLNKGKLSIAIDLRSPEGRELARSIITAPEPGSGIFVTNYPETGFLAHDALAAQRADLITLRVQGWGDGRNGVDYTVNAAIGVPYMTGPTDIPPDQPVNSVLPAWDLMTGAYGAFAVLAAVRRRATTGQGGEIRLALSDLAMGSLSNLGQVAEVSLGADRPRSGNTLFGAFGRDFRTRDGHAVMIVAITPKQWSGLVAALDLDRAVAEVEAALGLSFAIDEGVRYAHADRLYDLISPAIAARDLAPLTKALDRNSVCWERYRTLKDAVENDPRCIAENPLFDPVLHPGGSTYPTAKGLARFGGDAGRPARAAPRLGQDTEQVLADHLGLSAGQIGDLMDRGIVAGQ